MNKIFFFYFYTACACIANENQHMIIIIITTLSQEDNIFGTSTSLTYGPQLQLHIVSFVIDK